MLKKYNPHGSLKYLPGIALCGLIAVPAWFMGRAFPVVGSPIFGILSGMVLTLLLSRGSGTSRHPFMLEKGIRFTSKKLLQLSVILLGFGMNLRHVIEVGRQSLLVIVFTISASLLTAAVLGRIMNLERGKTILIGVGTSICGGSAIAAAAPVIEASDEEVAHAISTIFLFNVLAVFLFPSLGRALGMTDLGFGMWAGTAINDTSSVVAAGTVWSNAAGNDVALTFATVVKLTRTLMIVPITLVLAMMTTRQKNSRLNHLEQKYVSSGHLSETPAHEADYRKPAGGFEMNKVFPWFVIGFIMAAILNSVLIPGQLSQHLVTAGKFLIVMAMAAIGLNTHLVKLLKHGLKPIVLGTCCWMAVAGVSLMVQYWTGLW